MPYQPRLNAEQTRRILSEIASEDKVFTQLVEVAEASDELGNTFEAYGLLILRGEAGFSKILDIALAGRKVKHRSVALTIFSIIAEDGLIANGSFGSLMDEAITAINTKLKSIDARNISKKFLHRLTAGIPEDEYLNPISMSLMHMYLGDNNRYAQNLIQSLSNRWLKFGSAALDEYESLLEKEAKNEPPFQEFFQKYPQFLDPMAMQVWSQPDFHGALEPDFVVRRFDDTYLVVEIEKPAKRLITKACHLSADATKAEKQATDYREFLNDRILEAKNTFPNYKNAECLTIVGTEDNLNHNQIIALRQANEVRSGSSKIIGFDRLLSRAKTQLKNLEEGEIEVINRARII